MQLLGAIRSRVRSLGPARVDALIAAAFLVEGLLEAALLYPGARYVWIAVLATVAVALALTLRRRAPLLAVALAMAGFVAYQPLGREINDNVYSAFFAVLFLLFSFGLHEPRGRQLLVGVALTFATGAISSLIDSYPNTVIDVIVGSTVIAGGPILLGRVIANRSRLNATLLEKAEGLRRNRTDQAEQAAAEERARIANELHDVVAHAMSAMVVQAGGARRLAVKDPERARAAFAAVEDTGREALTEIRRLLGVLRHQDDEIALAPQPSLRHLASLVRRVEAAGLPVALEVEGEERPLPPGVDLTAYRLVQAALGGALEQGAAGRAEVLVRYRPDGVDLEVTDDGAGGQGSRTLPGVRERVSLYGGQLHAGARRSGGHAVRAKLPVGSGA
jgi:signal transduction histidine kinase